ncbi:uncharacterized protein LOC132549292 [Ylistrum balloti]|uniref:uncharacterized protein LOC132549292 n=1 Tax=Ylistrum balloti TaxID=509963 RepID=UPI00290594AA|nr:uncharacterized protein LOC132549292 [Ylistrum balloti]
MELKRDIDNLQKLPSSNEHLNMDDEETCGTGSFSVNEHDPMLNEDNITCPISAPAPCLAKCADFENSLTTRLTNDLIHVTQNPVTPRNVIGHCKLYGMVIVIVLSIGFNIALLTFGLWYGLTRNQSPSQHASQTTTEAPSLGYRRYLVNPDDVKNLVAVPCDARENLMERFPGMVRVNVNVSSIFSKKSFQEYCYLPKSDQLNHFLRIVNLVQHSVNGSLGIKRQHCVSLTYPTVKVGVNGSVVRYEWSEYGKYEQNNIFKVLRDQRTAELQLNGPTGYYMVMASTVYKSTLNMQPTPITLGAFVNDRKVVSQSKILLPSDEGFTSLSFHDVIHMNRNETVKIKASEQQYLYNVTSGVHTAQMCCIPVLGGCNR